jgi:hypothetical protein
VGGLPAEGLAARLQQALRQAPRRHRLPPLPADAATAQALGRATALAWSLAALDRAQRQGQAAPPAAAPVFTAALDALVRAALHPQHGDAAFQARLLQARSPAVDAWVRLQAQAPQDARRMRAQANALAHPARLQRQPPGTARALLARLHALSEAGDWPALQQALADASHHATAAASLARWQADPALARLALAPALQADAEVRRYQALRERAGPLADSAQAAAAGHAAGRRGSAAEAAAAHALARLAQQLNAAAGDGRAHCTVLHGLRNPPTLPAGPHAKAEWDLALVWHANTAADEAAHLLLLAEVKASPAAAAADLPRLLRGLSALSAADAAQAYAFSSAHGPTPPLQGASLQRLRPHGDALPPQVVYVCDAAPEPQPSPLTAASRTRLLADPLTLAHAARIEAGEHPPPAALLPLWQAIATVPRWRAVLRQHDAACRAREALLTPGDLADAGLALR